jgi:HPt (histidine-containing phosphotransfer) domain-containing protein
MIDLELDELKREFLAEARGKVQEIESALDGRPTPDSLARFAYLAHQLKGSGGSYGYQSISTEAAEIEKAVEQLAAGESRVEPHFQQLVAGLRSEIDRCIADIA